MSGTVCCRSQGQHGAGFEVWFGYGFFQFQSKTCFNRDLPAHPWWCRNPVTSGDAWCPVPVSVDVYKARAILGTVFCRSQGRHGAGFEVWFGYGFFQFQSKTRFSQDLPAHPWWCRNPVTSGDAWCPAPVSVDVYKARAILGIMSGTVCCRSQGQHRCGLQSPVRLRFFPVSKQDPFQSGFACSPMVVS